MMGSDLLLAIAAAYGSDVSASAMEHRFRPIKEQAKAIRAILECGEDPKDVDILNKEGMNVPSS